MSSILSKFLELVKKYQSDLVLAGCVIMLTIISFNLGKLSASSSSIQQSAALQGGQSTTTAGIYKPSATGIKSLPQHTDLSVVASKKSKSKYYHFTWCPGAKQISPANKLTFATEQEAITAGYHLATNCVK